MVSLLTVTTMSVFEILFRENKIRNIDMTVTYSTQNVNFVKLTSLI